MIETHDLQFTYPGSDQDLKFADIKGGKGEQWLLLGQSGSGKTTLLHLLAGLRTPSSGTVSVNGQNFNKLTSQALDQFRGKHIGIVFQQSHFVRSLTVLDNLLLAQRLAGNAIDRSVANAILKRLNIDHKVHQYPSNLSVGEQQRAAIARALINTPDVILADEPTSALDDYNTEQVIELLRTQADAAGATLLIVTHDTRLKSIFDQRIEL